MSISIPSALLTRDLPYGKVSDLVLYVNSTCNLRCRHCYVGNELLSASNEIDTASIQALLQAYNGADRITVLGGEPMMHAGITTILDALRHTRIREKRLTTNLTLLTEQVEESIIGSDIRVCVSIDGPAAVVHDSIRGRGSYGKTLANLNRLLPRHRNLEVIITMGRWNSDHLEGYFNFFRGLGVQMVNVHRLSLLGNALRIGDQQLQPSEWQAVVGRLSELTAAMPKGFELRYEVGYLDQEEYVEAINKEHYHLHRNRSFYSQEGKRLVIFPDGKLYISSEYFHSDSNIGTIDRNGVRWNDHPDNELLRRNVLESEMVIDSIDGNRYVPVSVSFKRVFRGAA